jgi:hypothetical protein
MKLKTLTFILILTLCSVSSCAKKTIIGKKGIVPNFFNEHILYADKDKKYDVINIITDGKILLNGNAKFWIPIDAQIQVYLSGLGYADIQSLGVEDNKIIIDHFFPGEAMLSDPSQKGVTEIFKLNIKRLPN